MTQMAKNKKWMEQHPELFATILVPSVESCLTLPQGWFSQLIKNRGKNRVGNRFLALGDHAQNRVQNRS